MKKLIVIIAVALLVLIVAVIFGIGMFLDGAIKKGVETVGPMLTKTEVKLEGVSLSIMTGSGKLTGLVVGNPQGFKTPSAISVGSASLAIQPSSVFADKVVIKSINVQAPEVTFETDLKANNLSKILANLEAATGGPAKDAPPESQSQASKKLQVDDFVVSGGKVNVSLTTMGGKSASIPLPDIHLTGLGTGPEGITAADLTSRLLKEVLQAAAKAAAGAVTDILKGSTDITKELDKATAGAGETATKAIGDLFKKK